MLADIEQFRAEEIDAQPGEVALPDADGAVAVFVREGELTLTLDDGEHALAQETWAFVPADVSYSLVARTPSRLFHLRVGGGASRDVVIRRAGGVEGDRITDRPDRRATVLVESDELTISEFRYGPGQQGAPRHVHREHADAFLVLEGELTFHLRDDSHTLPAGTLVVFPPGLVHGFDHDGDGFMRCFNFHTPSFRFADYMRGQNPDFDQFEPPEDGGLDPDAVVVARLAE